VSFALLVLVAIVTAVAIIVVALSLSKLVRGVIEGAGLAAPERRSPAPNDEQPVPLFDEDRVPPFAFELAPEMPDEPRVEVPETPLEPYVPPGRRVPVKYLTRSKAAPSDVGVGEEAESRVNDDDGSTYERLGEDVTAVLTAAEHAAAQIRDKAVKDAEDKRRAADENAAAMVKEAQAVRAEADRYSEQTRSAANDYARVTRGHADESAAQTLAEAEEQAHVVLADAEENANELIADAVRRRDALTKGTEDIEGRIESMLMSFRGVTSELEAMLSLRGMTATTGERTAEDPLDDALKRAAAHTLSRTDADR
jgi:hypothetical protein